MQQSALFSPRGYSRTDDFAYHAETDAFAPHDPPTHRSPFSPADRGAAHDGAMRRRAMPGLTPTDPPSFASPGAAGAPPPRASLAGQLGSPLPMRSHMDLSSPPAAGALMMSPPGATSAAAPLALGEQPSAAFPVGRAVDDAERWRTWVVVFGFAAGDTTSALRVLQRFQQLGEVLEHRVGRGNWLFLRYATALQTEKARAQSGVLVSDGALVAVEAVTAESAERLGLLALLDGAAEPNPQADDTPLRGRDGEAMRWTEPVACHDRALQQSAARRSYAFDASRDMLQPRRRMWYHNVCKFVADFFFN